MAPVRKHGSRMHATAAARRLVLHNGRGKVRAPRPRRSADAACGPRADSCNAARAPGRRTRVPPRTRRTRARSRGCVLRRDPLGRARTRPARCLCPSRGAEPRRITSRARCASVPRPRAGICARTRATRVHELLRCGAHGAADRRLVARFRVRDVSRSAGETSSRSDRGGSYARARGRARRRARRDIRRVHARAAVPACAARRRPGGDGCRAARAALPRRAAAPHHAGEARRRARSAQALSRQPAHRCRAAEGRHRGGDSARDGESARDRGARLRRADAPARALAS